MPSKNLFFLAVVSFLLAWIFDQLFWDKEPGISFFVFSMLCLAGGGVLTSRERARPSPASLALLAPVVAFSALTFLRLEPFTLLLNFGLTLALMALLATTWLGGRWWQYAFADYVFNGLRLAGSAIASPFKSFGPLLDQIFSRKASGEAGSAGAVSFRPLLSILFGLLLALPLVAVLSALLSSADPIFEGRLRDLLEVFDIDNLSEYIFRSVYIFVGAHLLSGVFLFALLASHKEKVTAGSPLLKPFLGWIEASTVLACVVLLFAFFVIIQFQYFFGGSGNINIEGYTYSEYARRGFGELVAVAFISLLMLLGLSTITRREAVTSRRIFTALGIVLVLLVGVILVSAFKRLVLYEAVYGFTRLRTYTHVFMIWLGILLVATVLLDGFGSLRRLALVSLAVAVGFSLSLSLLNVDGFIVNRNVARTLADSSTPESTTRTPPLDMAYLVTLSDDAVPALFAQFSNDQLPEEVHNEVGAVLACRAFIEPENDTPQPWTSFNWPDYRAEQLYQANQAALAAYPVERDERLLLVTVNGKSQSCLPSGETW